MKWFLRIVSILMIILLLLVIFKWSTIKRLQHTMSLFEEDVIVQNFQNMEEAYNTSSFAPSTNPKINPKKTGYQLPEFYQLGVTSKNTNDFLDYSRTTGLLIIHNDTIVYESYHNDLQPDETHISWSVSKSLVATLVGIAVEREMFTIDEPVTKYLPQFKNTGYDNVIIKDILQMSSGVGFDENYADFNSDINKFGRAFAIGTSLEDFSKSLEREKEPGTVCHYVSINTQVLGLLLAQVTGRSITELTYEWLWEPMGAEHKANWIVDNTGFEVVLGGLNATLRDFSKLGLLYLNKGNYNNHQIISPEWISDATIPDSPHLMPDVSVRSLGYGYQWWIPPNDDGAFFAHGIYNQFIYIQPHKNLVITKLSANHHFKTEGSATVTDHLALFKAICKDF